MIKLEGVGHFYEAGQWLFRRHDVAVARGEVLAILGPNGRGKTTLLKAMAGLVTPREGRIVCTGVPGYVPQAAPTTFPYSVLDMVTMGRARQVGMWSLPTARDADAARTALHRLAIGELAERAFDRLSGGERQLVLIARALAADCDILLLDEPAAALDLRNQGVILRLMRTLAAERGLTVVFTSHHPQHAFGLADRALLMIGPDDYVTGPTDAVMSEANLARLYGIEVRHAVVRHAGGESRTIVPIYAA